MKVSSCSCFRLKKRYCSKHVLLAGKSCSSKCFHMDFIVTSSLIPSIKSFVSGSNASFSNATFSFSSLACSSLATRYSSNDLLKSPISFFDRVLKWNFGSGTFILSAVSTLRSHRNNFILSSEFTFS
uniref:Uncharacterized protein n=1 Tax=Cacopsylla melanoneura TaxID=428564 RepID=A0A8D8LNJ7_9HEMI